MIEEKESLKESVVKKRRNLSSSRLKKQKTKKKRKKKKIKISLVHDQKLKEPLEFETKKNFLRLRPKKNVSSSKAKTKKGKNIEFNIENIEKI